MNYAMATDYKYPRRELKTALKNIAETGFINIHWCYEWCGDYSYSIEEIRQIKKYLKTYGLKLLDTHGSDGKHKCWFSKIEDERKAGVKLVKNRIDLTAELGGDAIVMHIPTGIPYKPPIENLTSLRKSLDELEPYAFKNNIKIAIENMPEDNFKLIKQLLKEYNPDFLGFCYDTGHGNMGKGNGLKFLDQLKDRLICVHMHDNDGTGDQHKIPSKGTIDWKAFMKLLRESSYNKSLNAEVFNGDEMDEMQFLKETIESLQKLQKL